MKEILASYVDGISLRGALRLGGLVLGCAAIFALMLNFAAGAPLYFGALLGALTGLGLAVTDEPSQL